MAPLYRFVLRHHRAPGDVAVTTALVRDLKLTYGHEIEIDFRSAHSAIYHNNPHVTSLDEHAPGVRTVKLDYKDSVVATREGRFHFITAFHREFTRITGLKVPCLHPKPDLHLTAREKAIPPILGRYWLILGGGKSDMTVKHWDYAKYRGVVDNLRAFGLRFVQTGAAQSDHKHPPIPGVLNVVGWGNLRHLLWQIYHAEGVICPITCAMHVAAAFDKPCVVIAGGRESPWWESYSNDHGGFGPQCSPVAVEHRFLHTVGLLPCCERRGCEKTKVIATAHGDPVCTQVRSTPLGQPLPECMAKIEVDHVVEAVLGYYENGTLPPIGTPKNYPAGVVETLRV